MDNTVHCKKWNVISNTFLQVLFPSVLSSRKKKQSVQLHTQLLSQWGTATSSALDKSAKYPAVVDVNIPSNPEQASTKLAAVAGRVNHR